MQEKGNKNVAPYFNPTLPHPQKIGKKRKRKLLNTASPYSPIAWWQEALRYKHSMFEFSMPNPIDKSVIAFLPKTQFRQLKRKNSLLVEK